MRDATTLAVAALGASAALDESSAVGLPLAKLLPHVARAADALLVGDAAASVGDMLAHSVVVRKLSFEIFSAQRQEVAGDDDL